MDADAEMREQNGSKNAVMIIGWYEKWTRLMGECERSSDRWESGFKCVMGERTVGEKTAADYSSHHLMRNHMLNCTDLGVFTESWTFLFLWTKCAHSQFIAVIAVNALSACEIVQWMCLMSICRKSICGKSIGMWVGDPFLRFAIHVGMLT